jgi:hypothetical protein
VGWQTYREIFKDLLQTCNAQTLLINDFMAGVGDAGKAAIMTKVSPEAGALGIRVCYWGCEERLTFGEVGRANIRTTVGEQFVTGALQVPGQQVIPAPASASTTTVRIRDHLPQALKQLSIATDGSLGIPSVDGMEASPPVELTEEVRNLFAVLRKEFSSEVQAPVTLLPAPLPGTGGAGDPPGGGDPGGGDTSALGDRFQCGKVFANYADLIQTLTTTNGCVLKELDIGSGRKLVLC